MKVAICSQGDSLDSNVDSRFGRCPYFVLVETDTGVVEAAANPSAMVGHGAGIGTVQFLVSKGVEVVCTGNVGPNAYEALRSSGIKVYSVDSGTVRQVLEAFTAGKLKPISNPNVRSHQGMFGHTADK
ncbi:MAG: NifB/NifX family molybdenum-iron cluster-binding protein [Candidatus Fermentithermobacillus carboniphilus]|uniref:NifB/NifX family molybdenum-iron cluster-binding protein n=1 Tax=Candidatus Fermentithermobacillus carboniphilus TaxID=3085328 RepID=A0AAT9LDX6_9FIRM|nr:MAG: NifB/NifX family molybdenum-iron cluster-binding protein [Candidatus Fermentithermobacillus carboniphilus]